MALLPYFYDPWVSDYDPYYLDRSLIVPSLLGLSTPTNSNYLRMLRHLEPENSGISSIQDTKEEFKVSLDCQQFKPKEIKVKVADDSIIVEGKHEERKDEHGFVSREFTRKYRLPQNVKTDAITSHLSSDGLLQIVAPKKPEAMKQNVREIKVIQTKQPAIKQEKK